ncbi:Coronin-like protein crn1 [Ascosphaera atra]|nr:Coronin-like protein crn1 [Ascosphaera atra]
MSGRFVRSSKYPLQIFLWRVPENFTCRPPVEKVEDIQDVHPVHKLPGHPRKVGHVCFNPSAENVLASASGDYTVKVWDIEHGASKLSMNVGDIVQSVDWSGDGSMLVTTSRDKKLRIWDPRQERAVITTPGHTGAKNSRSVWLGAKDRVVTTGFSKMSDRQFALWDIKAPGEPIGGFRTLDSISGVCMPYWDEGTQCLYLAGKGDGNIRYFEYVNDKFEYLAEYQSSDPQRGIGFMPKRGVDMHQNEIVRAYKTVNDSYIEPISFIVPRKSDQFQDDIFPPTVGLTPAMGSADWFSGKDGVPPLVDMASLYEGQGLKKVTEAEVKTHTPVEVDQAKKPEPPKKEQPKPQPAAAAPRKIEKPATPPEPKEPKDQVKDQKEQISKLADKFADKEEEGSQRQDSAFDEPEAEPIKPVEHTPTIILSEPDEKAHVQGVPKGVVAPAPYPEPEPEPEQQKPTPTAVSPSVAETVAASPAPVAATTITTTTSASLQDDLKTIKDILAKQQATIEKQTLVIEKLALEVEGLKTGPIVHANATAADASAPSSTQKDNDANDANDAKEAQKEVKEENEPKVEEEGKEEKEDEAGVTEEEKEESTL